MVKISGTSKGKGFQGTIKRHNFAAGPKSHGSHNVRAPGSIGASATPSRVFKGIKGPGHMGGKRVTQRGLTVVEVIADHNLLLVRGAVPGPKGGTVEVRTRWLRPRRARPQARQDVHARRRGLRRHVERAAGARVSCAAELNARRQGTARDPHARQVRGGGAKPWRQKGTGRARAGSIRSPLWTGGGTVFGPSPRHYTVKVNRKARRAALRSVLSLHADRGSIAAGRRRRASTRPSTKSAAAGRSTSGASASAAGRARPRTRMAPASPSATSSACR